MNKYQILQIYAKLLSVMGNITKQFKDTYVLYVMRIEWS